MESDTGLGLGAGPQVIHRRSIKSKLLSGPRGAPPTLNLYDTMVSFARAEVQSNDALIEHLRIVGLEGVKCTELFFEEMINADYTLTAGELGTLTVSMRDGNPFDVTTSSAIAERVLGGLRGSKRPGVAAGEHGQPDAADGHAPIVPDAEYKTCPMCAEPVRAAARICRFCRHDFSTS